MIAPRLADVCPGALAPCLTLCHGALALCRGALALCLALEGCGSTGGDEPSPDGPIAVDVGLPAGADGLEFVRLEPGGSVPLQTFGQGGTHALLAVRTTGLGHRAFIGVSIENVATGDTVSAPAGPSPRLLLCRTEGVCDLLPLLVMTGGLVPPGSDRNGLVVRIHVDASNPEGLSTSVDRDAVLSTTLL
jgi:hypothetical protein